MSLTEILDELPRLTREERRLLCRRALAVDEAEEVATLGTHRRGRIHAARSDGSGGRRAGHKRVKSVHKNFRISFSEKCQARLLTLNIKT